MTAGGVMAALVVAGCLSPGVAAARLDAVSVSTEGSAESPPDDSGRFAGGSGELLPSDGESLEARLRFNINADVGSGQAREESGALNFTLRFTVDEGGPQRVVVEADILAEITRRADAPDCRASVAFGGVLGGANRVLESGARGFGPGAVLRPAAPIPRRKYRAAARASIVAFSLLGAVTHVLTYNLSATVVSGGCEAAVRGGLENGSTADCPACEYPGSPPRPAELDGIRVRITAAPAVWRRGRGHRSPRAVRSGGAQRDAGRLLSDALYSAAAGSRMPRRRQSVHLRFLRWPRRGVFDRAAGGCV